MKELLFMVVDDYKEQVKEMSDERLKEDRSHWMKNYGIPHNDYSEIDPLDEDIHTITIELEQLRRFGEIIYEDDKGNPIRKRLNEKPIQE